MLKQLLTSLQKEIDVNITQKGENSFQLIVNNDLTIYILDQKINISIYCNLIECKSLLKEQLINQLMKANLLKKITFGLTNDEKYLTLSTLMPYEVSYKELKEFLEEFVSTAIVWREKIDKFLKQT